MVPTESRGDGGHLGQALTSYCFGGLSEGEQEAVERHLMICEVCWKEFQRLDTAVRTLRFSRDVVPGLSPCQAVAVFGMSRDLSRPLAGHALFAVTLSSLFGLEWTIGLWSELGYSYDRFGSLAWALSAPVGLSAAGVLLLSLWTDARSTRGGKTMGLLRSALVNVVGLGMLVALLTFVLPAERTIQASFQTRTAAGGYLKDAEFIFAPLLVFVLPTFHTVVRLQRELATGRCGQVLAVFAARSERVVPRGMLYVPMWFLTVFLLIESVLKIAGTNHMLDALTPGPYAQLFSIAAYVSTGIWFAIAITGLWWYSNALNELKREARAIVSLDRRHRAIVPRGRRTL